MSTRHPNEPAYLFWVGKASERIAADALGKFVAAGPPSYRVHQLRAEYYLAGGDEEKAIAEYRKSLEQRPGAVQIHSALGSIYDKRGDLENAAAEFKAELSADPYSVLAMQRLGRIYTRLRDTAAAKQHLLAASKIDPRSAETQKLLGKVYFQESAFDQAAGCFRLALELSGGADDTLYFDLSRCLRKLGRTEEANASLAAFKQSRAKNQAKLVRRSTVDPEAEP